MGRMGRATPIYLIAALVLLGSLGVGRSAHASDPPGKEAADRPADRLAHWTAMLGSDRFVRRQKATRQLIDAREEALPHLLRAVYSDDIEVRYRAIYILQCAAQAEDHPRELAREMLHRLAAAEEPSVAQLAARALRDIVHGAMVGLKQKGARLRWEDHHVRSVRLIKGQITDDELRCLRGLDKLKELDLRFSANITDAGLEHIANLTTLEVLNLQATRTTDAGLAQLTRLQKLRSLSLERTMITDAGLKHLKSLRQLEILYLGASQVKGPGLRDLEELPITYLSFQESAVDDTVAEYIASLPHLKTLGLDQTAVTDACLPKLVGLKDLEVLWLKQAAITDACIPYLARFSQLRTLHVEQTHLSAAGLEKLKQTLPNVKVHGSRQPRSTNERPSNKRAQL